MVNIGAQRKMDNLEVAETHVWGLETEGNLYDANTKTLSPDIAHEVSITANSTLWAGCIGGGRLIASDSLRLTGGEGGARLSRKAKSTYLSPSLDTVCPLLRVCLVHGAFLRF